MANTLKFGNGEWYGKKDTILAYNDENNNYKPLPFDFSRASSATVVNKDGLIETVGSGEPRIDFKGNTKGSLLLEPSRSNYSASSELPSTWTYTEFGSGSTGTITTGKTDMFGGTNAVQIDFPSNAENVGIIFGSATSGLSSGNCNISIYVKLVESGSKNLQLRAGFKDIVNVNSTEFTRVDVSGTKSNNEAFNLKLRPSEGTSTGGFSIIVCHPQEENGSYATSYIPTSGSAVTRLADSCYQDNLLTDIINASYPFTMYAEAKAVFDSTQYFLTFGNRGASNQYFTLVLNNDGTIKLDARANGVSENLVSTASAISNGEFFKVAVSMESATSGKISVNGNLDSKTNFTQQSVNTDIKDLLIGQLRTISDTGQRIPISDVKLYNTALTDNELQQLTQV